MPAESLVAQYKRMLKDGVCAERGVYVVKCAATGLCKIGVSRGIANRLASIETSSATRLTLFTVIDGNWALEQKLHERYGAFREHGEWFRLANEQLREIVPVAMDTTRPITTTPAVEIDTSWIDYAWDGIEDSGWEPEDGWAAAAADMLDIDVDHPWAQYFGRIGIGPMRPPFPEGLMERPFGKRRWREAQARARARLAAAHG